MLLQFLALSGLGLGAAPAGGQPTISGLTATPFSGTCPAPVTFSVTDPPQPPTAAAKITLNWSVVAPNDAQYEIHVSENGGSPLTMPTSSTTYEKTIFGLVENGFVNQTFTSFDFAVSLVRKSDGAVLQTLNVSYAATYGGCAP